MVNSNPASFAIVAIFKAVSGGKKHTAKGHKLTHFLMSYMGLFINDVSFFIDLNRVEESVFYAV